MKRETISNVVVFCLLVHRNIGTDLRWLLAIVVSVSIVYCLTHIRLYFRTPTEPILGVIVAVLTVEVLRSWTCGGSGHQNRASLVKGLG